MTRNNNKTLLIFTFSANWLLTMTKRLFLKIVYAKLHRLKVVTLRDCPVYRMRLNFFIN